MWLGWPLLIDIDIGMNSCIISAFYRGETEMVFSISLLVRLYWCVMMCFRCKIKASATTGVV